MDSSPLAFHNGSMRLTSLRQLDDQEARVSLIIVSVRVSEVSECNRVVALEVIIIESLQIEERVKRLILEITKSVFKDQVPEKEEKSYIFSNPILKRNLKNQICCTNIYLLEDNHGDQTRKSLSWSNRLRIANEIASAIVYLHTECRTPIIHRYIKPSKVIIDQNTGVAKIVNFSLSASLPPGKLEVEDKVNGTIGYLPPEEMIYLENLPSNVVGRYIKEDNVMDIADAGILEEHGFEIRQQLKDYLELVKKCTADNRENRPYMIYDARELRRIENCYHYWLKLNNATSLDEFGLQGEMDLDEE
ncbi:hypothetical protein CQW23_14664 [Capsicum baccatum]|uniref:Protein kinase domain-containing protein n=1 Tax=Capsicum baccatum TaxID=33114 RepID=A0A2G2WJT4_CAPBA|nr:hypothetical protein CQW23_14664 [Capsicum baccatum]